MYISYQLLYLRCWFLYQLSAGVSIWDVGSYISYQLVYLSEMLVPISVISWCIYLRCWFLYQLSAAVFIWDVGCYISYQLLYLSEMLVPISVISWCIWDVGSYISYQLVYLRCWFLYQLSAGVSIWDVGSYNISYQLVYLSEMLVPISVISWCIYLRCRFLYQLSAGVSEMLKPDEVRAVFKSTCCLSSVHVCDCVSENEHVEVLWVLLMSCNTQLRLWSVPLFLLFYENSL